MSDSTLSAESHYDDQGLFVSLIVGAVLLVTFGGFMAFLHCTSILWLKRFYRPNHTIEPDPLASTVAAEAAIAARSDVEVQSPTSPLGSGVGQTVFAEHTVRPNGWRGRTVTRRKRLGISLPFVSTFFVCPRLRDWISIEEPSLRDRKDGALSPVHYTTPAAPLRHTSDRSYVPIRTARSPAVPSSPGDAPLFPTEYPPSVEANRVAVAQSSSFSTAAPPPLPGQENVSPSCYSPRSAPPTPSYGAVEPLSPRGAAAAAAAAAATASSVPSSSTTASHSHGYQPGDPLPKTATDPLVAIYLFTLKYFLALMFFGELFTMWIMVIARHDDYMRRTMLLRDIHGCGKQDDNETGCKALQPYCKFRGIALGCAVVPLHGIYDLTVSNIRPRSWRWTPVALLNLGFCIVLVILTLFYLRKVGQYVEAVMANQMRHALGYRVVCIRGLDTTDIRTESALQKNFLELAVYFPDLTSPLESAASPNSPNQRPRREQNLYVTNDSVFSEYHADDDSYTICECPGLNCLFSTAGMHFYVVRREDANFTEPGQVEQILITREPPFGLLDTIADTESAMANLQEAIADEKAMRRKVSTQNGSFTTRRRRRHGGTSGGSSSIRLRRSRLSESAPLRASSVIVSGGVPNSNENSGTAAGGRLTARESEQPMLMMRRGFPACCDKMPAVPYYEGVFYKYADEMNHALEQVPRQPVAGAAFVVFKDSLCAFEFMQLFTARFGGMLSSLTATLAGPPGRIFQNSLTAGRCALYLRFLIIFIAYIALILTWSIPISFLGSLESLSQIPGVGRFLTKFTSLSSTLKSLINAYLPVVVLALFNVALPYIIRLLVRMMGAFNRIECDGGQLYLQYVFMVMTAVIAQAAFQGALTRLKDILFDPNEEAIMNFIVACVTPSTGYFYAKVISATCLSTWVDLLDPIGILTALLLRGRARIQRNYDALFLPCEFEFPRLLSFDLMILSMGLLFHMTAPLLGLLTIFYFFVRYWSQRAKQTDRYRPTLSPAHDCTDFGVPAQVIRSVMWLYCFAETGGVLLMGLRDHSGGVVLCSFSLGIGIALTIFVYSKTRKWTATLAAARHLSDTPHPFHHTHPVRYQQRSFRQQRSAARAGGSISGGTPMTPQPASPPQQEPPLQTQQDALEERDDTLFDTVPNSTTPLQNGVSRQGLPPHPQQPHRAGLGVGAAAATAASATSAASQGEASNSDNLFENNPEDKRAERQLNAAYQRTTIQEDGAMDGYEHVTLNQVLFDTSRNPFLSHLLPRKAGVTLRFQPKHQRLAPIDAAAEVRTMHETNFVVERYWDRGMTWFEEDTGDGGWNGEDEDDGDDDGGAASEGSGRDAEERARVLRTSPTAIPVPRSPRSTSGRNFTSLAQLAREESSGAVDTYSSKSRGTLLAEGKRSARSSPEVVVLSATALAYPSAADTYRSSPPPPSQPQFQRHTSLSSIPAEAGGSPTRSGMVQSSSRRSLRSPSPPSTSPPLPLHSVEETRAGDEADSEVLQRSVVTSMVLTTAPQSRSGRMDAAPTEPAS